MKTLVPPIKCQGIKTKLVPLIRASVTQSIQGRWIEPFCGSCVVALNVRPHQAILADANPHIIALYRGIKGREITPGIVRKFLARESEKLKDGGEDYYYEVRSRFNQNKSPLDFLFLNRSCFNGLMRFNKQGEFNVPFCRKPGRFTQSYVTKIVNQVRQFAEIACDADWQFINADYEDVLSLARREDWVYADPPYMGRHVDYYNSWNDNDEAELATILKRLPCKFILSTWSHNPYRQNPILERHWDDRHFHLQTLAHFYHVGPTEDLRNPMVEALITNYEVPRFPTPRKRAQQFSLDL